MLPIHHEEEVEDGGVGGRACMCMCVCVRMSWGGERRGAIGMLCVRVCLYAGWQGVGLCFPSLVGVVGGWLCLWLLVMLFAFVLLHPCSDSTLVPILVPPGFRRSGRRGRRQRRSRNGGRARGSAGVGNDGLF